MDLSPHALPRAQTPHDDLTGTLSADFTDGLESLARLAKRGGIDIDRYQPVGLNLVWADGTATTCFYCLDRQRLEGFALEHGGKLPVVRCQSAVGLDVLLTEVKELEINAFDHTKALEHFSWVEDDPKQL